MYYFNHLRGSEQFIVQWFICNKACFKNHFFIYLQHKKSNSNKSPNMARGSRLIVIYIQQAGFIYISALWLAPSPPRPLKHLVISVRCVWPRECELDAVWVSCSACLLFVTVVARRWMSLSVQITLVFATISSQAGFHPLWSLFISNRLENLRL